MNIRFRGKYIPDERDKAFGVKPQWVYGYPLQGRDVTPGAFGNYDIDTDNPIKDYIVVIEDGDWNLPTRTRRYPVLSGSLQQFTGLTDSDENDIYAGDIIQIDDYNYDLPFVVDFDPENSGYPAFDFKHWYDDGESNGLQLSTLITKTHVIGNIIDNPDIVVN